MIRRLFSLALCVAAVGLGTADAGCAPTRCAVLFGAKAVTPPPPASCTAGALDFSQSCNLVYFIGGLK